MRFLLLTLLASCVSTTEPTVELRPLAPGDSLALTWSAPVTVDGNRTYSFACGHEVSHPCPYITFATVLGVEGDTTVIGLATGGSNANGVPAENINPSRDAFELRGDALVLPERGDDAGLRHEALVLPALDGSYSADIEYTLFNVAGETTFHVEGTRR